MARVFASGIDRRRAALASQRLLVVRSARAELDMGIPQRSSALRRDHDLYPVAPGGPAALTGARRWHRFNRGSRTGAARRMPPYCRHGHASLQTWRRRETHLAIAAAGYAVPGLRHATAYGRRRTNAVAKRAAYAGASRRRGAIDASQRGILLVRERGRRPGGLCATFERVDFTSAASRPT